MDAKELRDTYAQVGIAAIVGANGISPIILRALDLLVAVEESGDELVRRLHQRSMAFGAPREYEEAAARIVAQDERIAKLEAALKPFANYACDPPCGCHNCVARDLLAGILDHPKEEA